MFPGTSGVWGVVLVGAARLEGVIGKRGHGGIHGCTAARGFVFACDVPGARGLVGW